MNYTMGRFWSKVDRSGACWEWRAATNAQGYGSFRYQGRSNLAHRVSWALRHDGDLPDQCVLHRCDNPLCVNPDHLFLGSRRENTEDMVQKGRSCLGERAPHAKLSAEDVRRLRRLYREGTREAALARQFNLHQSSVNNVLSGRTWGHLTGGTDIRESISTRRSA